MKKLKTITQETKTIRRAVTLNEKEIEAVLIAHFKLNAVSTKVNWDIYLEGFVRSVTLEETITAVSPLKEEA